MIIDTGLGVLYVALLKTDLPGDDILATSNEVKAQTLDHVVKHLQNVILTETRERERKRANIALKHITKWSKHYDRSGT